MTGKFECDLCDNIDELKVTYNGNYWVCKSCFDLYNALKGRNEGVIKNE